MKVFGSPCWVFNDHESLGKFDARGEPGTFLGYGKNTHAYKVLMTDSGTLVESMNVTVDDNRRNTHMDDDGFISDDEDDTVCDIHTPNNTHAHADTTTDITYSNDQHGDVDFGNKPNQFKRIKLQVDTDKIIGPLDKRTS